MANTRIGSCGLSLATAISLTLWAAHARAQDSKSLEEVVVTGSFIEGTATDTALPVTVVSFEDIKNQGSPSNLELIKGLPEVGSVQGESNRFAFLPNGAGSVNLRSLSSARTVVLLNGRRLPNQSGSLIGGFQNTNLIPNAAVGRVEILKDGGAVIYGADAVGGVVNYITRNDQKGMEVDVDYNFIPDSDGDYSASVLWGGDLGENFRVALSGDYSHRSELRASERSFAFRDYLENNSVQAFSPAGSPGSFIVKTRNAAGSPTPFGTITPAGVGVNRFVGADQISGTGVVRDTGCTELGGFRGFNATLSPTCYYHVTQFEKLVENSDSYQFFGELNGDLSDKIGLHAELLYSKTKLPSISVSPSDAAANFPVNRLTGLTQRTATLTPAYFVPGTNPAVAEFLRSSGNYTAAQIANITNPASPGQIELPQTLWRLLGNGGNPVFGGESRLEKNDYDLVRISTGLDGELGELFGSNVGWSLDLTYARNEYEIRSPDIMVSRLQDALNGFGSIAGASDQCTGAEKLVAANAGNTGLGCFFLNPFSSGISGNAATGVANPGFVGTGTFAGYSPGTGLQNATGVLANLYGDRMVKYEQDFFVVDALITGNDAFKLPGGEAAWAFGLQFRQTEEDRFLSDLNNVDLNPCVTPDDTRCLPNNRPGLFINPSVPNTEQKRRFPVYSAFAELKLPLFDNFDAQVAGRYETFRSDRGADAVDSFNPSFAFKWQALENFALRGSIGRTFSQVDAQDPTQFLLVNPNITRAQASRPAEIFGNPDLESETGVNFNVGFIAQIGSFQGTIDYYNLKVKDVVGTPNADSVVNSVFNAGLNGGPGVIMQFGCSNPFLAAQPGDPGALIELGNPCNDSTIDGVDSLATDITKVRYQQINSGTVRSSGLDTSLNYNFDWLGGNLTVGTTATYVLNYDVDPQIFRGIQFSPGYSAIGSLNEGPGRNNQHIQRWRASAYTNYNRGPHNLRLSFRFSGALKDDRDAQFAATNSTNSNPVDPTTCVPGSSGAPADAGLGTAAFTPDCNIAITGGRRVNSFFTTDLTYRLEMAWDSVLNLTVNNVLDRDPPFARFALSYDPFIGTPLGRTVKFGLEKKF